ncbi:MAG: prepilin-type N-terminal cleavage/methylation domain-containing protein [Aquificae bacterium]|nr:prepilin-type N-terminal cleavage/methylation domain-containing protein [Aquificota bacterium]
MGFTLVEVLVVVILLSLVLSTVLFLYKSAFDASGTLLKESERLERISSLYWDLTRAVYGAKRLKLVNGTELYLITTGGKFYRGVVKAAYVFKNRTLYYYEFPYPYGSIDDFGSQKPVELGRFESFKVYAVDGANLLPYSYGRERLFRVEVEGQTFYLSR